MMFEFLKKNRTKKRVLIAGLLLIITGVCFYLVRRSKTVCDIIEAACILTDDIFYQKSVPNDKSYAEWHTKKYLAAVLLERNDPENISDPDLKTLLAKRPDLPASWLKKIDLSQEEGVFIDETGNTLRSVFFLLIDGDIAWCYTLTYNNDGTFKWLSEDKRDAKDYDPKYEVIIQEVNQKVSEEMEHKNIKGLGSCHTFWRLKKEYLKVKGINWKSPPELNPGTCYD